ncbi:MAG: hypothetical protein QXN26_06145, partial [Thermoplasmataceae archaeon]
MQKTAIIAAIVTLMMLGSAFALLGNSSATGFQTGTVSYQEGYYHGAEFLGAGTQSINVTTLSGVPVTTLSGTSSKATLPLGQYYFTVAPKAVLAGSNYIIANGTSQLVNVTTGTTSITLRDKAYLTSQETFSFPGIVSGTSAVVKFITPQGFVFQTNTTSRNATAMVPDPGNFVVDVTYGGTVFTFPQIYNTITVLKFSSHLQASGFVYNATSGNSIGSFNVILINSTVKTYQNIAFTNGYFALSNLTNQTGALKYNYMVVDAAGYTGRQYALPLSTSLPITVNLSAGSSNVYSNYTLGADPQYLNLSLKYVIDNSTALPFFGNSSIGSLYWQQQFDSGSITSSSLQSYAQNITPSVTNYTVTIDGYNYYRTGVGKITPSSQTITNTTTFNLTISYMNSTIKETDLTSGFTVNLYALGTQFTMGAFRYSYQFSYDLPTVALASPTSVVTSFRSPVNITPQASNGYLSLKFTPSVKPTVVASEISLYWNGMVSTNYIVNSSLNNTIFVVPAGVPVSYNVSSAYYNPVTGEHDYKSATFSWYNVTGSGKLMSTGYNATLNQFNTSGLYKVMLNYTSGSGASNTTNFSIIAITTSQKPSVSLNVTSAGKVNFATKTVISSASMYVPQSTTVTFSGYGSYLNESGYSVPLTFTWYFAPISSYTGYKTLGQNITQTFNTPSKTQINSLGGPVTGYLNVTSVAGTYSNISLSVTVNDTTAPSPAMTLYNATGVSETNPVAGQVTTFSANSSTDPYYKQTSLTYNWSVV